MKKLDREVALRAVEREDHPSLRAWQNDPETAFWMDYPLPFSARDVDDDQESARREGHPFAITYRGRLVGKGGLNQIRWRIRLCALYLYIGDPSVRGRGVGRAAVMLLLTSAFEQLGMERVELHVLADNERALRTYEACGFELEGRLRGRAYHGGRWLDMLVMSVDRKSFAVARGEMRDG
jgi:RimJ/RimL family protein N-acetyltransferase